MPPPLPTRDQGFAAMARGSAGAALGSILAGLPVLWGQTAVGGIVSGGLAIFWLVLVLTAARQFGRPARRLWLAAPMAFLWPAAAAFMLWFR